MARYKKNRQKSKNPPVQSEVQGTAVAKPQTKSRTTTPTSSQSPWKSRHIIIACGGTGGHLFPGIAVGEVLQARGHDVILLISEKKIDALASSGHSSLRFEKMPFLAMPKPLSLQMPKFLLGVWNGLKQCKAMIREHDTQVVLGMGGFTSFAPVLAGRRAKIKTLIHDSNAIPGKANKLTAKFCDTVLLGFQECAKYFPKEKATRIVGTPVRSALRRAAEETQEDPYAFFGLDPNRKTVLVIGGSQGARGLNNAVTHTLDELNALGVQMLHITGPGDYQEVSDAYAGKEIKLHSHIAAFCHRMELAYKIADIALARSGASTLAELAYFGVPSLLVPYPYAADDHQTLNARIFHEAKAGIMVPELDLSPEKLIRVVREITTNDQRAANMKAAAQAISHASAAEEIANIVEEMAMGK
ncbi:undecaprenyldiphospho-muramoylpentapeptide beta-N-acetylglucosaminyltransferase [Verrucomicrobium sp. BvORR106]|uniref:undecaprenyldiphospho-muramoylpentapeptide beta-N-acetylglucosaminyltransferase n=1 Tax=Verrucomicrobium sp. BvORR106 TaxID=1403819 RepID=UPI00056F49D8|nr:undecaprenyldiphospho-muramoylpentapeptide beta-N-acetylglucosaminyltransferase [Verrucomicrobium sp. BvORR106]